MGEPNLFDAVANDLHTRTGLDSIAARGTLRLALKNAGLDPKVVTPLQMHVVLERVLPHELETRGVSGADTICSAMADALRQLEASGTARGGAAPEDIFRRMRERSAS
jgi:hypothetical protein